MGDPCGRRTDPVTGRTLTRSVTFHGDRHAGERYANELAAEYRARRSVAKASPLLTVSELLERWIAAEHPWKPSTLDHRTRITTGALGHRFERLAKRAGVEGATLHRLRHNVATFLVERGQILQAQARLGHADASTTLREYVYALPVADTAVADAIDSHLDAIATSRIELEWTQAGRSTSDGVGFV